MKVDMILVDEQLLSLKNNQSAAFILKTNRLLSCGRKRLRAVAA